MAIAVLPHTGGMVEENVAVSLVSAAGTVEMPPATPKAVEHAEALGVDLTQVEGTGAGGTILKKDVEAAAPAPDEPVNPTPAEPPAPEAPVTEEVPPSG